MIIIQCKNPDLSGLVSTVLVADAAAAAGTLTVANGLSFAIGQYCVVGKMGDGNEKSEIILLHASETPTATTLKLAATTTLSFSHVVGNVVTYIPYNQIELSSSTDGTTYTPFTAFAIKPDADYTYYEDSAGTSATYYKWRYKNGSTYSDYSAVTTGAGFLENSVGYLKWLALKEMGVEEGGVYSSEWINSQMNHCLEFIRLRKKKVSYLSSYNYIADQTIQGQYKYTPPTDVYNKYSPTAYLGIRVGTVLKLDYVTREIWDELLGDTSYSEVKTQASAGSTTLVVDNGYDFDDSGTVNVYVAGTAYAITYTGITRTTGTLTGIPASGTGAITVTTTVDSPVWQGETSSAPHSWTLDSDGNICIWPLAGSDYDNMNLYADYFKNKTAVDSEDDTIEPTYFYLIFDWLCWRIEGIKMGGINLQSSYYSQFRDNLKEMLGRDNTGQTFKFKPARRNYYDNKDSGWKD